MKNKMLAIIFLSCGFIVGCGSTVVTNAEQTNPLKIWFQNRNGEMETWKLVDEETGVNYIVTKSSRLDGGVAVTERLNPDGTLYTSK